MKTKDVLENLAIVTPDHEVQMARSELYRAGKCAIELHNMLKRFSEQQGLEGWVQAKITKAADYLESVYHYLDYEMISGNIEEGGPVGPTGPIPPGAVPVGGAVGPSVSPAQAAAMAARATIDKKKAIEGEMRKLDMQKSQLQRQLSVPAQMQETTSAGSVASSMGGNGMGKRRSEVGSLFGGSYDQPRRKKRVKEDDKYDRVGNQLGAMMGKPLQLPINPMDPANMTIGLDKKIIDLNKPLAPGEIRLTPADRIREGGRKKPKVAPHSNAPVMDMKEAANPAQQAAIAIAKKKKISGKDRHRMREQDDPLVKNLPTINLTGGSQARSDSLAKMAGSTTATPAAPDEKDIKKAASLESSIRPKFTGYYKGTDKGKPGKKMVGGD